MSKQRFDRPVLPPEASGAQSIPEAARYRPERLSQVASSSSAEDARTAWADFDSGTFMVAEFISAILAWGGIGWLADRWLGTAPWLLAAGGLLGTVLGFYLMYVRSGGMLRSPSVPRTVRTAPLTTAKGTAHGDG